MSTPPLTRWRDDDAFKQATGVDLDAAAHAEPAVPDLSMLRETTLAAAEAGLVPAAAATAGMVSLTKVVWGVLLAFAVGVGIGVGASAVVDDELPTAPPVLVQAKAAPAPVTTTPQAETPSKTHPPKETSASALAARRRVSSPPKTTPTPERKPKTAPQKSALQQQMQRLELGEAALQNKRAPVAVREFSAGLLMAPDGPLSGELMLGLIDARLQQNHDAEAERLARDALQKPAWSSLRGQFEQALLKALLRQHKCAAAEVKWAQLSPALRGKWQAAVDACAPAAD